MVKNKIPFYKKFLCRLLGHNCKIYNPDEHEWEFFKPRFVTCRRCTKVLYFSIDIAKKSFSIEEQT